MRNSALPGCLAHPKPVEAASSLAPIAAFAVLLCLSACNGLYFGDNPRREFPKETGPLIALPPGVRQGTAQ